MKFVKIQLKTEISGLLMVTILKLALSLQIKN